MDTENFKCYIKNFNKIEEEAFAIQLMAETEKFLEDKTLSEFPEPLKKLIEF